MKPLVSILIPCYNCEKWLAETLDSALAQTWQNIEIIVVDDGSIDNSLAILKTFKSQKTKVIHQLNRGASAARNKALKECQGDFIQYLDADDLLASEKIEQQVQLLTREENLNCIASGKWARFYHTPTEAKFVHEPVWNDMSPVDWLVCSWEGGGMMHPAAWLVPRDVAEAAGVWNETLSLNDDGEYFCRVVLASKGVKFCSEAQTYYRSGIPGSLSRSQSNAAWKSGLNTLELCTNYLLAQENSSRTRHACATKFQRFIYSTYPHELDLVHQAEREVHRLGGSNLKPEGGYIFKLFYKTLGWKTAKRIQKLSYRFRA